MEFTELVRDRRSIRQFLPEPITNKDIREIISIATNACNSGNKQFWNFIVIQNESIKNEMVRVCRDKATQLNNEVKKINANVPPYVPQEFYLNAPVVIGVVATAKYRTKPDLLMLDLGYKEQEVDDLRCRGDLQTIGAVTQLILLAAWEKGFGSCWMTGPLFARKELEEVLGITNGNSLAALIPIGKPAVIPPKNSRKPLDEIVKFLK
ncbi:nitroreductase [Sporomusaceae bacterium BoRhaA]|uniref:nitroreductase family protein n=1 Tax=Pelorhabdus rhamnosifermentans TaxID=2772457 RepID=UPI001C063FD5|nr:nitroreductase family protein [Pelorhabdus rhamnosifermentans]MBU2699636.1 nitroreductase [Pelorhabdus rhamnosifermentans]